jgi:hypothetical protein
VSPRASRRGLTSQGSGTALPGRQPPRLSATLLTLAAVLVAAYALFIRTPPAATPNVRDVAGTFVFATTLRSAQSRQTARTLVGSGTFAAEASGDASGTFRQSPGPTRSVYDATSRTEVSTTASSGGASTTRTVGAWPPVWQVATHSPLDYQGLAAVVRSAVEDNDRHVGVKLLEEGGREAWRAAMTFPGDGLIELVVDQRTDLVVWYAEADGEREETLTVTPDWRAAFPADRSSGPSQTPMPSPGWRAVQTQQDRTFSYTSDLAEAGRVAGFEPLEPTLIPDGFALRAVATAALMGAPLGWLSDRPGSPPLDLGSGERQVALLYTRGLSWFTVQELGPKAAQASTASIRHALSRASPDKLAFQASPLQYGSFAGKTAYTWYEKSGPTLLVNDDRHVAFATGALTRRELISLAEGLDPLE